MLYVASSDGVVVVSLSCEFVKGAFSAGTRIVSESVTRNQGCVERVTRKFNWKSSEHQYQLTLRPSLFLILHYYSLGNPGLANGYLLLGNNLVAKNIVVRDPRLS